MVKTASTDYYNGLSVNSLDILHKLLGYVYEISDGKVTKVTKEITKKWK